MQSKHWSLRLDPETRKLLDTLSERMQRSRANVIKVLIHQAAKSPALPPSPNGKTKRTATKSATVRASN
jgi:predicted transcriptional regulator